MKQAPRRGRRCCTHWRPLLAKGSCIKLLYSKSSLSIGTAPQNQELLPQKVP